MKSIGIHTAFLASVALFGLPMPTMGDDCGEPISLKGKDGDLQARLFGDGSIGVRAPLAVNPDGGPPSYTVGDHGFTYIANGLTRWRNGARQRCDSACTASFKAAERAGFAAGTDEFCVYAMEVEALQPGEARVPCTGGFVVGNGKGRPVHGAMLDTVADGKVQAYVSTTSLRHLVDGKPTYLSSEALPIAVTPRAELLGKVVWVGGGGMMGTFALIGDVGPAFGEGSIALHQLLRTGRVTAQRPGPIPRDKRCLPAEIALRAPFESRPDGGKSDRCRSGHTATTASDVRAYVGIDTTLDFVILGAAAFERSGSTIQIEVTPDSIAETATRAGYSGEKIARMLACLRRLGTHQGSVDDAHLTSYLNEFVFRFNRRRSRSRGMVFYRALELAVDHAPVRYRNLIVTQTPREVPPTPPRARGHPPSMARPPANRPWRNESG
jgi:hypothetical protein